VLDSEHPNLHNIAADDVLSTLVFCGNDNLVKDVLAGGRWVVQGGRHIAQAAIEQRYMHTIAELRTLRS
jgi:formimidoylglutamate deiminase